MTRARRFRRIHLPSLSAAAAAAALAVGSVGCSSEATNEPAEPSEDMGTIDDALLAGRRLSEAEVATALRNAGFPESLVPKMVCTAKWESSFYERASNRNRNGTSDRGLFQINSIHLGRTRGCPDNADALWDADTNARCAAGIYRAQGSGAWYGYRAHRAECDRYQLRSSSSPAAAGPREADEEDLDQGTGCYSPSLRARVGERACVQSRASSLWFQCREGQWHRGATDSVGPFGACVGSHGL